MTLSYPFAFLVRFCTFFAWPREKDSQIFLGLNQILQNLLGDLLNGVRRPLLVQPLDHSRHIVCITVIVNGRHTYMNNKSVLWPRMVDVWLRNL